MRILLAFLLILMVIAFACRKTELVEEQQYATFYYNQTQCADPWRTGTTDSQTLANVSAYLAAQGLHVGNIEIKQNNIEAVCLACQCKTGKIIYVTTLVNDATKAKYLEIGFRQ